MAKYKIRTFNNDELKNLLAFLEKEEFFWAGGQKATNAPSALFINGEGGQPNEIFICVDTEKKEITWSLYSVYDDAEEVEKFRKNSMLSKSFMELISSEGKEM